MAIGIAVICGGIALSLVGAMLWFATRDWRDDWCGRPRRSPPPLDPLEILLMHAGVQIGTDLARHALHNYLNRKA